jgi:hypothetical protein
MGEHSDGLDQPFELLIVGSILILGATFGATIREEISALASRGTRPTVESRG